MELQHLTVGPETSLGGNDQAISDVVRFRDLLLFSGRAAVEPATGAVIAAGFTEQARIVMGEIERVLTAAGSDWAHVLHAQSYLARSEDFPAWNEIWRETFTLPRPARTTLVADFTIPGILIEVQITAAVAGEL